MKVKILLVALLMVCVGFCFVPRVQRFVITLDEVNYGFFVNRVWETPYEKYEEPITIYLTHEDVLRALEEQDDALPFYKLNHRDEVMEFIDYMEENDLIITGRSGKYTGTYYVSENADCSYLIAKFQLDVPPERRGANK